jgi:Uma2 family endonuclease
MNVLPMPTLVTPDDLLRMPDGDGYELIDGRLKEKSMGGESSFVGGRIFGALYDYLLLHPGGWLLHSNAGYQCFPGRPALVRKPDVSFVRFGRLPDERMPRGNLRVAPDLAVEVVSPNDLFDEVDEKISEYLDVGVRLIWVLAPLTRVVFVFQPDGFARRLREDQELDGGEVLPGFRCSVRELFAPPTPAAPPS